jgi:hypothetical protein
MTFALAMPYLGHFEAKTKNNRADFSCHAYLLRAQSALCIYLMVTAWLI